MNEIFKAIELPDAPPKAMAIVIMARYILTRTCIFSILKREFPDFDICDIETTGELRAASERDVRLIALEIGDKPVADPWVEDQIATLGRLFPYAPVALLSARDDEASAAMRRGVRGFFSPSIPIEVAIAGLRLVLAGGVYRPLPFGAEPDEPPRLETIGATEAAHESSVVPDIAAVEREAARYAILDLTPREKHVLAALELGLPNKLIAARLNLSENTVKMHMRHIMRKCSARNRTEAVIFCSGRRPRAEGFMRA